MTTPQALTTPQPLAHPATQGPLPPPRGGVAAPWDETADADGAVREAYAPVLDSVARLSEEELAARATLLARGYADRGVTFYLGGQEQPFPLDPVPRVISADDWDHVERGVAQRVRALEAFLADLYGKAEVLADGIVPPEVVRSSAHFHRAAHGVVPPRGVRIHVSGTDLIRDEQGRFRVLEDNLRCPSGVSYVMENREAMVRVLPDLFGTARIRPVEDYAERLRAALLATAPQVDDPVIVVLTPGVHNSAYFEHSLLARRMGVELVEGRDLVVRDATVYMRTTDGERRVDVIYRRIDDEFLDPLHFRSGSLLGCPGLLNAARFGTVTLANAVGNGVADDKLVCSYVPDLVRYYLDEEPVLANVDTYRLRDEEDRAYVLGRLDELVLKPVDSSGGKGIVIGHQADRATLARLRRQIQASPRDWIAQPVVSLSTVPTYIDGTLVPRHIDLRPFAVHDGETVWVLPGGLTRVALREGSLVVNSSQGGGSKDTWVLARTMAAEQPHPIALPDPAPLADGPALELGPDEEYARTQQQQQQQQGRPGVGAAGGAAPC